MLKMFFERSPVSAIIIFQFSEGLLSKYIFAPDSFLKGSFPSSLVSKSSVTLVTTPGLDIVFETSFLSLS